MKNVTLVYLPQEPFHNFQLYPAFEQPTVRSDVCHGPPPEIDKSSRRFDDCYLTVAGNSALNSLVKHVENMHTRS